MSTEKYMAMIDQERAILHEALKRLEDTTPGKIAEIIASVEEVYRTEDDMGEKLLHHAAFVGITTTMQNAIEVERGT